MASHTHVEMGRAARDGVHIDDGAEPVICETVLTNSVLLDSIEQADRATKRGKSGGSTMPQPSNGARRRRRGSSGGPGSGTGADGQIVPVDPIVSIYPRPMDAKRAKDETVRARRLGKKLPIGHPYRRLPLWVPYWLARLINNSAPSSKPERTNDR